MFVNFCCCGNGKIIKKKKQDNRLMSQKYLRQKHCVCQIDCEWKTWENKIQIILRNYMHTYVCIYMYVNT